MSTVQESYREGLGKALDNRVTQLMQDRIVTDFSPEAREATANAAARAVEAANRINSRIGPLYTAERVRAELGGLSRQALYQRVKARRLLRVTTADEKTLYPAFQFSSGQLLPGLGDLLQILLSADADGWTVAYWLTAVHHRFGDQTALDVLSSGQPHDVETLKAIARADAAGWAQ